MKLKGIGWFEQNVDKVVVGLSGAVLLGVIAYQFLVHPNQVKVGSGAPVPPQKAFAEVTKAAQKLAAELRTTEPALPEVAPVDLMTAYRKGIESSDPPRARLVALGRAPTLGAGLDLSLTAGGASTGAPIAVPALPGPSGAVAAAYRATIDPTEVLASPELRAILPSEQPFDCSVVSVEATFNGAALRDALAADPDGEAGPIRAMPGAWWRDAVEVIAVELEREELVEGTEWTNATVVPPMPGRPSLLAQVQQQVRGPAQMNPVVDAARRQSGQVVQPAFYRTIAGPAWVPPSEVIPPDLLNEKDARKRQLEKQVADTRRAIERLQDQLRRSGGREREPEGGHGGDAKGGGREGSRTGGRQSDPSDRASAAARNIERNIQQKEEQLARFEAELAALESAAAPGDAALAHAGTETRTRLMETSDLRVWAHDTTARPGTTYRYRVRLVLNNPAFGRGATLAPEQRGVAEQPLVRTEPSEWTAPVAVDPDRYFFLTSATEGDALGGPRASAEVYEFYYGYWRKGSVSLEPGDVIQADVRLPKGMLYLYDLAALEKGAPGAPQALPVPPPPGPGGKPGAQPGEAPRPPGGGAGSTPEPGEQPLPPGVTLAPETRTVAMDSYLLDVARASVVPESELGGSVKALYQAYLRDPTGRIAVRIPEVDRSQAAYKRVSFSAREGETQGRPVVREEPRPGPGEDPRRPREDHGYPDEDTRRQDPDDGGGGGGGGG